MNFDDLKDQVVEKFHMIWGKIQDDPNFQSLMENYESLNQNAQLAIKAALGIVSLLTVLWLPLTYLSSSASYITEYEENKTLIRKLLRIKKAKDQGPQIPDPMPANQLISDIKRQLESTEITPDQIVSVSQVELAGASRIALPKEIQQFGVDVNLKKINLNQLVDIGNIVESLHSMAKLIGMSARANNENPHYYDVNFRVATFELPAPPPPPPIEAKPTGRRKAKSEDNENEEPDASESED